MTRSRDHIITIFTIYVLALKIEIRLLVDLLIKITIPVKYFNYTNIFLSKYTIKLSEHNNSNYAIKL